MGGWLRRFWWMVAATLMVLAVALWLAWPSSSGGRVSMARARAFTAFTVCVLTDAHGVTGGGATTVWRGVLAAQDVTNAKAQYLATLGDGSAGAAVVALNTLAARGCGLIVAVGGPQTAAVWKQAGVFPQRHFVVVGGLASATRANVAVIADQAADAVAAKVAAVARSAAAGRFTGGTVS